MEKSLLSRKRIEIAIAVILVALYAAVPSLILPRVCSQPEQANKPISYRIVIDGKQTQTYSASQHQRGIKPSLTSLTSETQANGRAEPIDQSSERPKEWRIKFWCEVNASRFCCWRLFTPCSCLSPLIFCGVKLTRLAWRADEHADKMERSIAEAARAARAMEGVAEAMFQNASNATTMIVNQRGVRSKTIASLRFRCRWSCRFPRTGEKPPF